MTKARDLASIPAGSGDFSVDTDTLYVDATNNRVGIGTANPSEDLEVGNGVTAEFYAFNALQSSTPTDLVYISASASNSLGLFTNSTERLRIDSAGRVKMPNQPIFFARPSAGYSISGSTIIAGTWAEGFDVGNNFNTSGGIFTAPVDGKYFFTWAVFITDSSVRTDAYIELNGAVALREEISGYSTTQYNRTASVTGILGLSANDTVKFGAYTPSGAIYVTSSPWSYACGYLIG